MASLNSNHDWNFTYGIVFAILSTMNLALLNVFSKKLLTNSYTAISLLHLLTKCSLVMFLPFFVCSTILNHRDIGVKWPTINFNLIVLLLMDGMMSFGQNLIAFTLLSLCTPLTYSIANCSKRVAIISVSFVFLSAQNVSPTSMFGIFLSLFGIFCYNLAKHAEKYMSKSKVTDTNDENVKTNGYYSLSV